MPPSLKQALADPFAFGNHPDVPWRLPEKLPPFPDLQAGVRILEGQLQRVDRKHAAFCLSKLLVGFNERKTGDEVRMLLEVWIEACGDLPADLWSTGTLGLLQTHKFGMPKPVHLREQVADRFNERATNLRRAQEMLGVAREGPKAGAPWVSPETMADRLRGMRNSFRKVGNVFKAAHYERKLAGEIGREPHAWALAAQPPATALPDAPKLPPLPADMQARTLVAAAAFHREQGRIALADRHLTDARALAPQLFEPVQEHRDVAEAV